MAGLFPYPTVGSDEERRTIQDILRKRGSMRTDIKRDEDGPYYHVRVQGAGEPPVPDGPATIDEGVLFEDDDETAVEDDADDEGTYYTELLRRQEEGTITKEEEHQLEEMQYIPNLLEEIDGHLKSHLLSREEQQIFERLSNAEFLSEEDVQTLERLRDAHKK